MPGPTAITIGNFDGAHLGHAALLHKAREAVGPAGRVVVMSFDPHPLAVLKPAIAPVRLSIFQQRSSWLQDLGADEVLALTPTLEFLAQSPHGFMAQLVRDFSPAVIVEGPDFRFGKGREGSVQTLRALELEFGFEVIVLDPVEVALSDCSIVRAGSTMARWLLSMGRVRDAALILGRPYEIAGVVVPGDKRGRAIGVPTVNLGHGDVALPADGIYSGSAMLPDGAEFSAAISIGAKPTFGHHPRVCEAHLIGYQGPLDDYGWPIRLRFHQWLRDQMKFDDVNLLVGQLHRDIARCRGSKHTDQPRHASASGVSDRSRAQVGRQPELYVSSISPSTCSQSRAAGMAG